MKFYIFDENGTLTSSYDTRTQAPAYNTANPPSGSTGGNTGGGSVATIPKAILPLATFWTDTASMPTTYRHMDFPIVQYDTSHCATMEAKTTMASSGYVSGLTGNINGPTTNRIYFQVYKNGEPTGIIAQTDSGVFSATDVQADINNNNATTFVKGGVLAVMIRGDDSGTNQSFSATIEVTFS